MKTPLGAILAIACSVLISISATANGADAAKPTSQPAKGQLTSGVFDSSEVFPGTTRDYSVYVPASYRPDQPAGLMVFMDGKNYAKPDGAFRIPELFDRLIESGDMPTTIAVFVNPGTIPAIRPGAKARSTRSFEYDSMSDRYSRFLIDEFLPVATEGLNVSTDPRRSAVCGISSGGICAFTVAWHRPDRFGKVLSHIGSFTDIRGGWAYPGLIRKTKSDPKPIKVYLQEGKDDLNNLFGNWPLANQDVAAALQFAGYQSKLVMTEGGHSGKYGGIEMENALRWLWDENAESDVAENKETQPKWEPHPDAVTRADVPKGTLHAMPPWESDVFAGTIRDWWIYIPAQYDAEKPAGLMVFQDGGRMSDVSGRWRVPTVFDNLIASGEMPPTIAVFLNPGHDKSKPMKGKKPSNRGYEYDSLGGRYVQFLNEEILPEVEKRYNLSNDPQMRAIGGSSSGAICALNAAWERPDLFSKVYSSVGSFTHLRGGNVFPSWVRKTEPKPIRVYMADTSGDVDNAFGSWPWANQLMASALNYMGYDVRFDWAEGYKHNADFGSSKFPDAMRWLWRNEKHQPTIDTSGDLRGDLTLLKLLIPGEGWQVVADNLGFADAPCHDAEGNFYFCDMRAPAVYRVDAATGDRTVIAEQSVSGLEFGPGGLLYGCQGAKQQVISIDPATGDAKVIATGVVPNDLAVSDKGFLFITETKAQHVTRIDIASGEVRHVDHGITRPNGIAFSGDGGTLAVSDHGGAHSWMFRVSDIGELDAKMPIMEMRLPIDPKGEFAFNSPPPYVNASKGDGMSVDRAGRYYITSERGVQIFDPTGRLCGVLPKPDPNSPLTSCTVATSKADGSDQDFLYVTNGKTVFRRKLSID